MQNYNTYLANPMFLQMNTAPRALSKNSHPALINSHCALTTTSSYLGGGQ